MSLKDDLVKARSYLVFMGGLLAAFALVYTVEQHSAAAGKICQTAVLPQKPKGGSVTVALEKPVAPPLPAISLTQSPPRPTPRALTEQEMQWARIAWRYFENNTQPNGMTNSVDQYPASTYWDTASYLMAAISAERLGLISRKEFDERMGRVLVSMGKMALFEGKLPNKSYNTQTLAMVNYANKEAPTGIGWSALDIGRMMVPLNILVWQYPRHTPAVRSLLARWDLTAMIRDGQLYGAYTDDSGKLRVVQEGRLGYEQYAAKALTLIARDVSVAQDYRHSLAYADIQGVKVPVDTRTPARTGAQNYVLSEPYLMDGLEFGFDRTSADFAFRVYQAQEARYRQDGILTAVTEDHLDVAPYFVYNTVFNNGKSWVATTDKGKEIPDFRMLSVKAVFGWHALYRTEYTGRMMAEVATLHDAQKGWYTGKYEKDGRTNHSINANTNAMILESLAYIRQGSLLRI